MPVFEFTSPDGETYEIEGPEGATAEQAFQILMQQIGTQPPKKPSLEDMGVIPYPDENPYGDVRSSGFTGVMEDIGGGMMDMAQGRQSRYIFYGLNFINFCIKKINCDNN